MKIIKVIFIASVLFLFTGCSNELTIHKETDEIVINIDDSIDFDDYIYGLKGDEQYPCDIDLEDLDVFATGTYSVRCTVEDEDGDTQTDHIDVTVEDETVPTITVNPLHKSVFPINTTIDYEANIEVTDNSKDAVTLDINSSAVNNTLPGVYDVIYTARDASGNETSEAITYEIVVLEAPSVALDITNTTSESFDVDYVITDNDNTFLSITLNIYDGLIKIGGSTKYDVEETYSFNELFSNREYRVEVIIEYSLTLGETIIDYTTTEYTITNPKPIPSFELTIDEITSDSISVQVTKTDLEDTLVSAIIEISGEFMGEQILWGNQDFTSDGIYTFNFLYANHDYDITITYTYDNNDQEEPGEGQTILHEMTLDNQPPEFELISELSAFHEHTINFEITNVDEVITSIYMVLDDPFFMEHSRENISIYDTTYTFDFPYSNYPLDYHVQIYYDLRDGTGQRTRTYDYTFDPIPLEVTSISTATPIHMEGNDFYFNITVNDPNDLLNTVFPYIEGHNVFSVENIAGNEYRVRIMSETLTPGTHTLLIEYFYAFDVHGNITTVPFSGVDSISITVIMDMNPF